MKNQVIKDYLFILVGALLMGLSISVFMIDARVIPGGISGIAMSLHYLDEGIPTGLALWLMNIPLFLWGVKELGWGFAKRTIFGFSISAFTIDVLHGDFPGLEFMALNKSTAIVDLLENDFLFLIIIGAVLLGIGMGFVLKHRGTFGGADVVAAILQKRYGYKAGNSIMVMNVFIITFATIVIYVNDLSPHRPALSLAFYAFLLTFIISRIIDMMIDGFDYARSALIISDKCDVISDAILNRLMRGATALKGRGLYKRTEKDIIMTVITRREIIPLKALIKEIDPDAFVIISTVHEVLGEGFKKRT
jgi:uncharacterized membrane-anchored protein YitT (DUF2179 family)